MRFTIRSLSPTTVSMNFLALIGRVFLVFIAAVGRVTMFTWGAFSGSWHRPFYTRQLLRQMLEIGYYSLPVVGMTALLAESGLTPEQRELYVERQFRDAKTPELVNCRLELKSSS